MAKAIHGAGIDPLKLMFAPPLRAFLGRGGGAEQVPWFFRAALPAAKLRRIRQRDCARRRGQALAFFDPPREEEPCHTVSTAAIFWL